MKENKIILGIETSCDDTSVAILKGKELVSHLSYSQIADLEKWGGVVPEVAARNHLEKITPLIKEAITESKIKLSELDLIAVTAFPGLLGPLLTGINAAKTIALLNKTPILPVNHLHAHLEAIHLTDELEYPYLGVLLSGGHSLYVFVKSPGEFNVLGGTIDDAAGEAFDKGGKMLGLGYPAGHKIDRLSKQGDETKYEFPIGLKSSADCRLSFSGVKTALRVFLEKNKNINLQDETELSNICASYQKAIVDAVLLKLKYALREIPSIKNIPIVVGGGVACNSKLRSALKAKFKNVYFVNPEFCTDNGAMIANYGRINFDEATPFPECLDIDARNRFIEKSISL